MPGTVHIANKIWTLTHCLVGEKKKKERRGGERLRLFGWHERKESGLIGENHFLWGLPFCNQPIFGRKERGKEGD
jgi:hypothetical protein